MKSVEKLSNTVTTKSVTSISSNKAEFSAKKLWLLLLFGASLIYMGNPPHAGEKQGTESQGSGRGTMPAPGYTDDRARGQGSNTLERGSKRMEQGEKRPGSDRTGKGTSPSTEEMNRNPAPGSENINRDTTGPGGDNMMRDAVPGGSGIKRE
ncbi:hypothetical protein [Methylobacter sp. YRD-M1]|uniref:hypothetical protein n=1 Tax=Methylobacter sp. YRD-M1 TaxID=2911520 RepID=UPI00227A7A4B|nr:hypothetical protein [Methylobacter sp. YRD-M1]WAK03921.1 hypothetical protein LZ558_09080 [Methylobacter sp. YRD-M1]